MLLRYFYDDALAQASYMVGCQKTGEAIIIDPNRTVETYLSAAFAEGFRITGVTETHIHADYVSGTRELASRTGARVYLSGEGTPDWQYSFAGDPGVQLVHDGDFWMVGNIRFEVRHTPGHTPEHIMFIVTDTARGDHPLGIFSGDFVFVGDVGRPDLLETAAGFVGTKDTAARQLFATVQRFKSLPDYLQVWPGHGAGSACGKSLGAVPSSTFGYERLFNWAFQIDDESVFVHEVLVGQPTPPAYFAVMKRVNKQGPTLLKDVPTLGWLKPERLRDVLASGTLVVDTRPADEFVQSGLSQVLNIPFGRSFSTYAGTLIPYDAPFYLIAREGSLDDLRNALVRIGLDNAAGVFAESALAGLRSEPLILLEPDALHTRIAQNGLMIVDVRAEHEYADGHLPGSVNIPLGMLAAHLDMLPRDHEIVTQCKSGMRSHIAATLLRYHGFEHVTNLKGGIDAWQAAGFATE